MYSYIIIQRGRLHQRIASMSNPSIMREINPAHTWRIPILRRDGASEHYWISSPAHTPLAHTISQGAWPKSEPFQVYCCWILVGLRLRLGLGADPVLSLIVLENPKCGPESFFGSGAYPAHIRFTMGWCLRAPRAFISGAYSMAHILSQGAWRILGSPVMDIHGRSLAQSSRM